LYLTSQAFESFFSALLQQSHVEPGRAPSNKMSDIMDGYWRTPPLARTLATTIFVSSVAFYLGFLPGRWLFFHYQLLLKMPPQIWRLATGFLISQPKLGIILDPYFVFSYASQLETASPKFSRKEDLAWYLVFVCSVIMIVDTALGLSSGFYLQGLILALAYTATQDQRGVKANFFFITIPAQLVPYTMMFVSLLMVGPNIFIQQLCGLFAAHLHDFLSRLWPEFGGGSNLLPTPSFLSRLVAAGSRLEQRAYGTAFRAPGPGRESGSGPLPASWETRGTGHRLGGD